LLPKILPSTLLARDAPNGDFKNAKNAPIVTNLLN
jgi:hypothetical protein